MAQDFVDLFLDYTEQISSPPIFRLWAAIAGVAGALERRVWVKALPQCTYANLYVLLVAAPGIGKGVIDEITRIWRKVPRLHLAPDSVTSASLLDSLMEADAQRGTAAGGPGLVGGASHGQPQPPEELPGDRVAVLPLAQSPDDIAAWDTAAAAASLLMFAEAWRKGDDGDQELRTSKFGTEERAWLDSEDDAAAAETGLITWRPSGAAPPAPVVELRSSGAVSQPSPDDGEPEAPEKSSKADEDEAGEEERGNGISDLLVQDSALWGAWQQDPGALE